VFPRDCTSQRDGVIENLPHSFFDPTHLFLILLVGQERRVKIPITHVPKRGDLQLMLLRRLLYEPHHPRELIARHGGIFQNGRGRNSRQSREGGASGARQTDRILRSLGHLHRSRTLPVRQSLHRLNLFCDRCRMSVSFD
jgi:hypothetical protein